jgi:histidinol dehydrogenase
MSKKGMEEIGEACALIANTEGLTANEESIRIRLRD